MKNSSFYGGGWVLAFMGWLMGASLYKACADVMVLTGKTKAFR